MPPGVCLDMASLTTCWHITCRFLKQRLEPSLHASLFSQPRFSVCSHTLVLLPFPDPLPGPPRPRALCGSWLLLPSILPYVSLWFQFPSSFSFTFPRPPAVFNSVIMAYSVGTWHLLSPTLHSHPWLSCDRIPPLSHRAGWKLPCCQTPAPSSHRASCFLSPQGHRASVGDGGPDKTPHVLSASAGQCDPRPHSEHLQSVRVKQEGFP